jgi:hypothetical protein
METAEAASDVTPVPLLRWGQLVPVLPLAFALIGAVVLYWPSLDSPFVADDYVYLYSVRTLSFWHYVRLALTPGTHDTTLFFVDNFWRPGYFLSFQATERLFGGHVVVYHLLNLAIHLATVVLVWTVAWRLTRRGLAAGVAAVFFAVHPAGFEAVAWISSVNSISVPLGLTAWLLFMRAVERSEDGERATAAYAAAFLILVVAIGFHESAFVEVAAMGGWLVLVQRRERWREWRAYLPLVPYVALAAVYVTVRTRGFTQPMSVNPVFQLSSSMPGQAWYYVKLGLFPFKDSSSGWHLALERTGGVLLIAAFPLALALRRWTVAAVLLAFYVSLLPYSGLTLGVVARYFYGPSALLGIAVGVATGEVLGAMRRVPVAFAQGVVVGACALLVAAAAYAGNSRVAAWVAENPDDNQAWVEQLQRKFPELPDGGTLYVANPPFILALFDGVTIQPTAGYYYPHLGRVVLFDKRDFLAVEAKLGPNDRVYVFD